LTIETASGRSRIEQMTICNAIGQEMIAQPINAMQTIVNVGFLPSGVYYITLTGDNGTAVMKFVKE
jgi:hypothetical protein